MTRVTFVAQSSRDDSNIAASSERLVNCYAEAAPGGARTRLTIRSVPGETTLADLATGLLRAAEKVSDTIYAIAAGNLFSVTEDGTVTNLGSVGDALETSITAIGDDAAIAANGTYYVYDGTLAAVAGGLLTDCGSVTAIDQYVVITERGGQRFEWLTQGDPQTRNALYFQDADARNDNLLRGIADGGYLVLFGEESIELWYNTGQAAELAFARLAGGVIDLGLKSYNLVVKHPGGIFFVGDDGMAYNMTGGQLGPVATPAVLTSIAGNEATACFYYEIRGHKFLCIRFSDRPAWCYDLTTQLWHERASGDRTWETVAVAHNWGKFYAFNEGGPVYEMTGYTDVEQALSRIQIGRTIYNDGDQFSVSELEYLARVGTTDLGRDAMVTLNVSRNGGKTFGADIDRSMGDLGDTEQRMVWRALGTYRQFTAKFTVTDAADITSYSDCNVSLS